MKKNVLILNSHDIERYIQCPRRFSLGFLYEPRKKKLALEKGILFSKFLEIYYKRKMRNKATVVSPLWADYIANKLGTTKEVGDNIWLAMNRYIKTYKEETWIPLAVEEGFSVPIYEDEENLFILEGRPDLVVKMDDKIIVVDHKTQSYAYRFPPFTIQSLAYLYATGARHFCYNYIVFTKEPQFDREIRSITDDQIEIWKDSVITAYKEISQGRLHRNFNCSDKWGLCEFHNICIQPDAMQQFLLNTHFQLREQRRCSWKMK